jgi:ABC-type multidrug transport system permease subunit
MIKFLANFILVIHFLYVFYILSGLFYIIFGYFLNWKGIRNSIFRWTHLGAMGIVVGETICGIFCPLTKWEAALRQNSEGFVYYSEGFLTHWLHEILFYSWPQWIFNVLYVFIFLVMIILVILIPPNKVLFKKN